MCLLLFSITTNWLIEGMLVASQDIGMNDAIAKDIPDKEIDKRKGPEGPVLKLFN